MAVNQERPYLTSEGAQRLKEELEFLKTVKRQELAQRLRQAIQMGDLSENADYIAAKEEQGFLEGRIQELEALLRNAVIIENNGHKDTVDIGATVTIQQEGYPPETYTIVGSTEANPIEGRISHESPIGKALMGHKAGDVVEITTANGSSKVTILKVEF